MAADGKDGDSSIPGRPSIPSFLLPLIKGIKDIYTKKNYTDLTIACNGCEWEVNKLVLCAQSRVFRKQCAEGWKESQENRITLDEEDPQVIDAVLHWFYNWDYGDHGNSQEHVAPIVLDVRVFAFAEMKLLEPLKQLAAAKFTQRAETEWKTDDFAAAIHEIYTTIPEHEVILRQTVIRVVREHTSELFNKTKDYVRFRQVVRECEGFGDDVAETLVDRTLDDPKFMVYTCPDCRSDFAVSFSEKKSIELRCPTLGCTDDAPKSWWAGHRKK